MFVMEKESRASVIIVHACAKFHKNRPNNIKKKVYGNLIPHMIQVFLFASKEFLLDAVFPISTYTFTGIVIRTFRIWSCKTVTRNSGLLDISSRSLWHAMVKALLMCLFFFFFFFFFKSSKRMFITLIHGKPRPSRFRPLKNGSSWIQSLRYQYVNLGA